MQDELLQYYERELTFFRRMGQEFSKEYPKVAGRLGIEAGKCEDPHVERLIQAFAFMTARIQHKLDDEFPEITNALLSILYPHYLAPLPSMSIVEFVPDPLQGKLTSGYTIDKGTLLYSRPVSGTQCRFRTCYPTTLWPIEVTDARFTPPDQAPKGVKAATTLRLELTCQGGATFSELPIENLRFYLHGEGHLVHVLYELLLNNSLLLNKQCGVQVRKGENSSGPKPIELPPPCIAPVGFGKDEGLLPYPHHAFMGYRLLQEYFSFPQKFFFFDLLGLDRVAKAGFGEKIEVLFFLDQKPRLEQGIDASVFRLGCSPIINLFEQIAEPIRIDQTQFEYRVIPDVRRQNAMEIYGVNKVTCISPNRENAESVLPFYSVQHGGTENPVDAYWYTKRKPSGKKDDDGTEVYLSLVDLKFNPKLPATDTLTLHVTCTNRDLPGKLPPMSEEGGYFELEGGAPLSRIRYLVKPTKTLRPPSGGANQWRLISHLSLNYLSIAQGGPEALQEILKLYDFTDSAAVRKQISGITNLSSRRVVRRPPSMGWNGFCRGLELSIEIDEDKFVGSGVFLFASVLETFFGLYASTNSFIEIVAKTAQREGTLRRWPPRAGEQILL